MLLQLLISHAAELLAELIAVIFPEFSFRVGCADVQCGQAMVLPFLSSSSWLGPFEHTTALLQAIAGAHRACNQSPCLSRKPRPALHLTT